MVSETGSTDTPAPLEAVQWGEHDRRLSFLRRIELFSLCSPEVLAHLVTALSPVSVEPESIICREGDPGDAMYIVREGTVCISTRIGDDTVELARLGPGQSFGELALLTHGTRTATVRAATPVSLWRLSAQDFDELLAREPALAAAMLDLETKRGRENVKTIFEVERRNVAVLTANRPTIRIGRGEDNDLVFDSSHVSRYHAILERSGDGYQLRDLNSANGTSVNGVRVRVATLSDGDEIRVANERFIFDRREISRIIEPRGVRIEVSDVCTVVRGAKTILNNVTLSILPGEFIALVGRSGAGKSTLMDAMSGVRPATSGTVRYNGRNYYEHMDLYRNVLGYVPQDDIIHKSLPVQRTFYHAARLRFPPDTSHQELEGTVAKTIGELGLEAQADTRVQDLSGGQRKRSSIGVELLTEPRVFFLDEPTSGLDPATETQMMHLMRELADAGSTVVATTHATKNVLLCDKVVFLARGGHLAFAGSPTRALQYFGSADFDEIYERLDSELSPEEWAQRFRTSQDYAAIAAEQAAPLGDQKSEVDGSRAASGAKLAAQPTHQLHQFVELTYRELDMLVRYPVNLLALFVQPVLITVLLLALFKVGLFSTGVANPIPAVQTLLVLSFSMFFFGVTFGLNEICQEFTIFFRERMVNLGILPYVLSKVAVLGPFLLLAELLILLVLRVTGRLPNDGISTYSALFLTLALTSLAGLAIGLLASSVVPNPDAATRLLPAVLLPQALFCGGFVARPSMGTVGQWLSGLTVMRWSFEAAGRNLNVNALASSTGLLGGNPLIRQYGDAFSRDPWQNWVILGGFAVIPLIVACLVLRRRTTR
jgi:ABC-type multidrug transport system ATPase subunit/CRP-like cAMP-binding protein